MAIFRLFGEVFFYTYCFNDSGTQFFPYKKQNIQANAMKLDIGNCEFWEKGCTNVHLKDLINKEDINN